MSENYATIGPRAVGGSYHRHVRITPEFLTTHMLVMSKDEIWLFLWLQIEAAWRARIGVAEIDASILEVLRSLESRELIELDISEPDERGMRTAVVGFKVRSYPNSPTIGNGGTR